MSWTLLNTRPAHQARPITEAAKAAGMTVIECPTLYISCMPFRVPAAQVWVFTSPNAVRCYLEQQKRLPEGRIIAIGPTTAETLSRAGKGIPLIFEIPKNFNSEHVLKMRVFDPKNAAAGQKVAIIKGKGGRKLLKEALWERGWAVEEVEVYRRVRRRLCDGWAAFRQAEQPLLLAMSVEAVEALLAALPESDRHWLMQVPVAALSARISQALHEKGWQGPVHVAPSSDGDGMAQLLTTLGQAS